VLPPAARARLGLAALVLLCRSARLLASLEIKTPRQPARLFNQSLRSGDIATNIGRFRVWGCISRTGRVHGRPVHLWGRLSEGCLSNFLAPPRLTGPCTHFTDVGCWVDSGAENGVVPRCPGRLFLVLMTAECCATRSQPQPDAARRWSGTGLHGHGPVPLLTRFHMVELG